MMFLPSLLFPLTTGEKKRIKNGKGEKETIENQPSEQMRLFDLNIHNLKK